MLERWEKLIEDYKKQKTMTSPNTADKKRRPKDGRDQGRQYEGEQKDHEEQEQQQT